MITADLDVCYNVLRERGLIYCRNPACGVTIGSYLDGPRTVVNLFNVREMLFEPQLLYSVGNSDVQDIVLLLKFADDGCKLDDGDIEKAKSYVLEPYTSRVKVPTPKSVVPKSEPVSPLKRKRGTGNLKEPMVKIPKSVFDAMRVGHVEKILPTVPPSLEKLPPFSTIVSLPSSSVITASKTPIPSAVVAPVSTKLIEMYLPSTSMAPLPSTSSSAMSLPSTSALFLPSTSSSANASSSPAAIMHNDVVLGVSTDEPNPIESINVGSIEEFERYYPIPDMPVGDTPDLDDFQIIEQDLFEFFGL